MSTPSPVPALFDRRLLRLRRERSARLDDEQNFLHRITVHSLLERYEDVRQKPRRALVIGGQTKPIIDRLKRDGCWCVASDLAFAAVNALVPALVADDEDLPFKPHSFDIIISNLVMQNTNNPARVLSQLHGLLSPGGVFFAAILGDETLRELRACLYKAEQDVLGGVSPRVAPCIAAETMTGLLSSHGFVFPVVDRDSLDVEYADAFALMRDLRGMGMTNVLHQRLRTIPPRTLFKHMNTLYAEHFPAASNEGITARFDIVYMHGWFDAPRMTR